MTNQAMIAEAVKLFAVMDTDQQARFGKLLLGARPFRALPDHPFAKEVAKSLLLCACDAVEKENPDEN